MTLKTAFIGAGRVIDHHCDLLVDFPAIEIAAVCDLREDRGEPIAERTGAPWYADYREMLTRHPEIDLVVIATPSGMHYEHACDVIEGYGKHLLIEKPTVLRPDHLTGLYEKAREKGVKIFPIYQNRFNRAVARVRKAVEEGELGAVRMASVRLRWCRPQGYYDRDPWRGTWSHDGGAMTNQGIHYIDLLRYLAGDVARVCARTGTLGVDVEVEDTGAAVFELKDGGLGVIEITTAARPDDFEASISIVGDKGTAVIAGLATNEITIFSPDPDVCRTESAEIPNGYGVGHRDTYQYVLDDLAGRSEYPIGYADALGTLTLLHGLYRSSELGEWVDLGPQTVSEHFGRSNEKISQLYRTPAQQ